MMRRQPLLVTVLAFSLGGCATIKDYCRERAALCVAAGALIVAGVVLATQDDQGGSSQNLPLPGTPLPVVPISDVRLKRDVRYVTTLDNGVRLYTFRYWNDDRLFSGVLAQELLADERYREAVQVSPEGFYRVNLEALGLRITGDADQYREAGRHALAEAASSSR